MRTQDRQELNFISFYSAYIKPMHILLEPGAATSHASRVFAKASILESIGWLTIGTSLGHFHELDVLKYTERAYSTIDTLDEVRRGWEHIFDPEWLALLFSSYSGRRLPSFDLAQPDKGQLSYLYETCLLVWSPLSRSHSAFELTAELNFAPSDHFEKHVRAPVQLDDLAEALALQGTFTEGHSHLQSASFFAGYGEMIEFLGSFRAMRNRYLEEHGEGGQGLTRKIAQLLRWRLFFFESQTSIFYSLLERYLDILQVSDTEVRSEFAQYVQQLASDWADNQAPLTAIAAV